jgi:hypothetical protein
LYAKCFVTLYGPSNTEDSAICLDNLNPYAEPQLITDSAKDGISIIVFVVVITGDSPWTVYEGPSFNGKSVCVPAVSGGKGSIERHFLSPEGLNLTRIGSVVRGC